MQDSIRASRPCSRLTWGRKYSLTLLVASQAAVCIVLLGCLPRAVASVGKPPLEADRVHPVWHEWVCFSKHKEMFIARATHQDGDIDYAEWTLEGPELDRKHDYTVGFKKRLISKYRRKFSVPGEYRLTCTFVDAAGHRESVCWMVTSSSEELVGFGRKGDPCEPGTMVFIKGGAFMMGAPRPPREEPWPDPETPVHEVQLGDYYIGRYLVTTKEFCEFLNECGNPQARYLEDDGWRNQRSVEKSRLNLEKGLISQKEFDEDTAFWVSRAWCNIIRDPQSGRYRPRGNLDYCPTNCVTWLGAFEYCKWLWQRTGRKFRLPTEAEWEYAARGTQARMYPWGKEAPVRYDDLTPYVWWEATVYGQYAQDFGLDRPRERDFPYVNVGSFGYGMTPDGVADMTGSLLQWCYDVYSPTYYADSPQDNPTGPAVAEGEFETAERVVRGLAMHMSGWGGYAACGAWARARGHTYPVTDIGFRLAMDADSTVYAKSSDLWGRRPLHNAAYWGREETVAELVAGGACVDARDASSATALHMAAEQGHKRVVELLLAGGADPNAKDDRGWTPLDLAVKGGHQDVAELLKASGAGER